MKSAVKFYFDADEDGNFKLPYLIGTRAIPDKEYEYFFLIPNEIIDNIEDYKVVNGGLVKKN